MSNIFENTMKSHFKRRDELLTKFVDVCRHLETQLRDLNANNTADRIQALIGEYDDIDRGLQDAITSNPEKFIRELIESMRPK